MNDTALKLATTLITNDNAPKQTAKLKITTEASSKLVLYELLYFVNGSYDHHPLSLITSTLAEFYRDDEILSAKQILVQSVDGIDGLQPFCKKRSGDNKVKASIDDILNIFKSVNNSCCCRDSLPTSCAAKRDRLATITDELSDLLP